MKKYLVYLILIIGVSFSYSAMAEDLLTVYQQALENDPVILQAKAVRDAAQEAVPQGRAALFPNISASGSSINTQTSAIPQGTQGASSGIPGQTFNTRGYQLTLTQPLFNYQDWAVLQVAHKTASQAQATYNAAIQELIIRVSAAYFNVLQAQDTLRFTEAEKAATGNELKQFKDEYQVGLATMTDVYQAQATYDGLVAQAISAQNDITNNLEALAEITGKTYSALTPVRDNLPLLSPIPNDVTKWIGEGENYNWSLLSDRDAEQAAKENIRVNFSGHLPTVNAIGTYQNGNDIVTNANTTQWQSGVGVQVNLPLFEGGLVNSQTRQAQDNYVAASQKMEGTYRQVIFNTKQAFNNVVAGISKIQADKIAVTSAQSALDSTTAGLQAGTKTILDVLTANQNLFQAQANLSADRYAYINNTLLLKQASGSLSGLDVTQINRWLQGKNN